MQQPLSQACPWPLQLVHTWLAHEPLQHSEKVWHPEPPALQPGIPVPELSPVLWPVLTPVPALLLTPGPGPTLVETVIVPPSPSGLVCELPHAPTSPSAINEPRTAITRFMAVSLVVEGWPERAEPPGPSWILYGPVGHEQRPHLPRRSAWGATPRSSAAREEGRGFR